MSKQDGLKLLAMDSEDLDVISAILQDSAVRVDDITFLSGENRFVLVVSRVAREVAKKKKWFSRAKTERRRTGLQISGVTKAAHRGLDATRTGDVLNLLALHFDEASAPSGTLKLIFSDDAEIRLDVDVLELGIEDLGPAWDASEPVHAA